MISIPILKKTISSQKGTVAFLILWVFFLSVGTATNTNFNSVFSTILTIVTSALLVSDAYDLYSTYQKLLQQGSDNKYVD